MLEVVEHDRSPLVAKKPAIALCADAPGVSSMPRTRATLLWRLIEGRPARRRTMADPALLEVVPRPRRKPRLARPLEPVSVTNRRVRSAKRAWSSSSSRLRPIRRSGSVGTFSAPAAAQDGSCQDPPLQRLQLRPRHDTELLEKGVYRVA